MIRRSMVEVGGEGGGGGIPPVDIGLVKILGRNHLAQL